MRRFIKFANILVLILAAAIFVKGTILQPAIGGWLAAGPMAEARGSAASALLQDGRILITGGDNGSGPVASAEFFDTSGAFVAAPPMSIARRAHSETVLANGKILVAGGSTGAAATNTAEIFDPVANAWLPVAGGMIQPRANHTACLLADGRVLLAGGENAGVPTSALEIFDPVEGSFSSLDPMTSPRTSFASIVLPDGRVLLIGGSNGSLPVASTEIFDPTNNTLSAGPALSAPRMAHSATTLIDGRVLVAGGNDGTDDIASAEIYDPSAASFAVSAALAAPRRDHATFLLPHNNNVLIVGGTSAGAPVITSELFTSWQGTFSATGSLSTGRTAASGSALQQDGALLIMGGKDASGNSLATSELYGFPTVTTDKPDYPPGTTVTITGAGWKPGETVTLTLVESPLIDTHGPYTAIVQPDGTFSNTSFVTDDADLAIHFTLTVAGSVSQSQAQTRFWDNKNLTVNFAGTGSGNVVSSNGIGTVSCVDASGSAAATGCSDNFANNDIVTLTETPTAPSTFGGWAVVGGATITGGTCTSSSTTCKFNMNNNGITVTATFNPGPAAKYVVTSSNDSPAAGAQVTISAQLADNGGNPVHTSGKTVTWSKSGSGGSFATGTSTTNANGVAAVTFTTGTVAETTYTFTATDSTSLTGTSGNVTTVAGTATQLVFLQQPTNTVARVTISPSVQVQFEDANGNILTGDNGTNINIAVLSNPGGGTLSGTTPVKDVNGISTFGDLSINKTGTGYTLRANSAGGINVTSSPFNITARVTTTAVSLNPTSVQVGGQSQVTVTVSDSGPGTQSNPAGTITLTSSDIGANGDTFAVCTLATSGANAATCTAAVTTHEVGTSPHTITAAYTPNDGVHSTSSGNAPLTAINPATSTSVSSSSPGNASTYGDSVTFTANVTSASGTPTGSVTFIEGSTCPGVALAGSSANPVTLSSGQATISTAALNAGSHVITACYSPTGSFTASNGSVAQSVIKATPAVTWSSPVDITYGTTLSGTQLNAAFTAVVNGSTVTVAGTASYSPISGTVLNAGNAQNLTVNFAPTDTSNFNTAMKTVQINVQKATPTVTVSFGTSPITYDGLAHSATATVTGVSGADLTSGHGSVSVNYTPGPGAPVNAGNYSASANFTSSDGNYTDASSTIAASLTIDKAPSTTSLTCPADVTYDGTPQTPCTALVTGAGELSQSLTVTYGNNTNAGTADASATFTGDANHTASSDSKNFTIDKAPSTTVVTVAGGEIFTYDGLAHPAMVAVTGVGGLNQSPAPFYSCGHVPAHVADSGCTASYSFTGDANHTGSSDSKTYSIAKAPSTTVVSGSGSFVFDGLAHVAAVSVTGVGGLNLTPAANYSCGSAPIHVAEAPCTASYTFAGDGDHDGSNGSAAITITKAPSTTVISGGGSFVFDGLAHAAAVSVTGVGGLSLTPAANYSCGSAPIHVAETPCTASYTFAGDGDHDGSNGSAAITITKAPSTTVISGGGSFVFDALAHAAAVSVTGGGGLNLTPAPSYSGSCSVAPIHVADTPCAASYTFVGDGDHLGSNNSTTIAITKAPSTTTITAGYTVTYDSQQHGVTASVTGVGGLSQSVPVAYNPPGNATVPVNAGTYAATARYPGDSDHLGNSAGPVTIIINKATPIFSNLASPTIVLGTGSTILSGKIVAGALVPNGSVSITMNSVTQLAAINPADGTFSSTFATGGLAVSAGYSISYNYAGSMNFNMAAGGGTLKLQYGVCLLYDPTRSVKSGATYPIKLYLCNAGGTDVSAPGVVLHATAVTMGSSFSGPPEDAGNANPDSDFRYDATLGPAGGYIFNLKTSGLPGGTFVLQFNAGSDPLPHSVTFGVK